MPKNSCYTLGLICENGSYALLTVFIKPRRYLKIAAVRMKITIFNYQTKKIENASSNPQLQLPLEPTYNTKSKNSAEKMAAGKNSNKHRVNFKAFQVKVNVFILLIYRNLPKTA